MSLRSTRLARFLAGFFRFLQIASIVLLVLLVPIMSVAWFKPGLFGPVGPLAIDDLRLEVGWQSVIASLLLIANVYLVATIAISVRLRAMMRTVAQGTPFVTENVARLRQIALIMGALNIFEALGGFLVTAAQRKAFDVDVGHFDLGLFIGMLVVLVLAEVFREGVALREDAEGTI